MKADLEPRELDFNELLGVEGAMPVLSGGYRLGQQSSCCVCCLPNVAQIHPPSDFLKSSSCSIHCFLSSLPESSESDQ